MLVSHGFTGSTGSMLPLARAFAAQGWNVECPTLTGHGTRWEDLVGVPAETWVADLEAALALLKARSRKVFIVGLSMGGTLALRLAQTDRDLAGVMVINHALVFGNPLVPLAGLLKHVLRSVPAIGSDIKAPGVAEPAYDRTPTAGVAEVHRLTKLVLRDLHKPGPAPAGVQVDGRITCCPCATPLSSWSGPRAGTRNWSCWSNSYHVATLDHDADLITAKCLEFVKRIANGK